MLRRELLRMSLLGGPAALLQTCTVGLARTSHVQPERRVLSGAPLLPGDQQDVVVVWVDASTPQQVMEGFGATTQSLVFGVRDNLTPELRQRAIEAAYGQVKLTMGTTAALLEKPSGPSGGTNDDPNAPLIDWPGLYADAANDNGDPGVINWSGFNDVLARPMKEKVIDLALPLGYDNFMLGPTLNTRTISPWLAHLRNTDYPRYLAEAAEQVLATQLYWRDRFGIVPRHHLLFNEPLGQSGSLEAGTPRDIVDIVKTAGATLRAAGFAEVKFVVPSDETEELSLTSASAVLQEPAARQYVGAIAYHPYPYGSVYASVPRILATAGSGQPERSRVEVRGRIRDLALQYGVSVWMTEVSHGEVPAMSHESFRGRAIHIHDELRYAGASAYFGMNSIWDRVTNDDHFRTTHSDLFDEDSTVVLIDNPLNAVHITGMGRAIGHYARWIPRGAIRLQCASGDPLVLASAFRDDANQRVVLVLLNNATVEKNTFLSIQGLTLAGPGWGERSTASDYWQPFSDLSPIDASTCSLLLAGLSVTSVAFPVSFQDGR